MVLTLNIPCFLCWQTESGLFVLTLDSRVDTHLPAREGMHGDAPSSLRLHLRKVGDDAGIGLFAVGVDTGPVHGPSQADGNVILARPISKGHIVCLI